MKRSGNLGKLRGENLVCAALKACTTALAPLSHDLRLRVLRGLTVWVQESLQG